MNVHTLNVILKVNQGRGFSDTRLLDMLKKSPKVLLNVMDVTILMYLPLN